jgi:tRNA-dihydrouridine synthase B
MDTTLSIPTFQFQGIPVFGDLIFAPMDGISTQPFRSLVRALGSSMSYTEFIPAVDAIYPKTRLHEHVVFSEDERPLVYQLLDNHPDRLARAAESLLVYKPDAIDINLGCPARDISNRGAGSGLLRQPELIANIISSLSKLLPVPVTAKIRLGWDQASRNYLEVARIIEDNGGALIAVHGRTRDQAYGGNADWDAIAEIKQCLTIPVIANGDVRTVEDIRRIKEHTRCDGVMIGRAALSNPWIFSRLDRNQVSVNQLRATIIDHLQRMIIFYGAEGGLVRFRKHILHYLSVYILPINRRLEMLTCSQPEVFLEIVDQLIETCPLKNPTLAK